MSSRGVLRVIARNENVGRPSNSRRLTIPEKIEAQKKLRAELSAQNERNAETFNEINTSIDALNSQVTATQNEISRIRQQLQQEEQEREKLKKDHAVYVLKVGENSDEIKAQGNTLKEACAVIEAQRLLLHQTITRLENFETLVAEAKAEAKAASTKTGEDVENVGKMLESLEEKQTAQATTLSGVTAELSCELQAVNRLGENIEILDATQKLHTQALANIAAGIANNANFAAERATEDTGAARAAAGNGASLDDFKQLRNAIERNVAAYKRGERTSASGQSDTHAQLRALRVAVEQRASHATCGLNQAAASFFPSKPTAARVARDEAWPVVGS